MEDSPHPPRKVFLTCFGGNKVAIFTFILHVVGAVAVKKAATTEDASAGSSGAGAPPALFEDCELRMKALDHSEMVSFYSSNADEEPANLVKQVRILSHQSHYLNSMPIYHNHRFCISVQGYLWRKTSRNMITTWERRWFVLDDSKLYYVSEHEDEAHKINVSASCQGIKYCRCIFCLLINQPVCRSYASLS